MKNLRRTKILATLGPATDAPGVLEGMFDAGLDVVRLNFSHGDGETQVQRANAVRDISAQTGRHVGILVDLQGPKIRIERFKDNKVILEEGQSFSLDINLDGNAGDETQVGISYKPLAQDVNPGDRLLLDDGRVVMDVVNVVNMRVNCTVIVGGDLSNNKGINLQGGGLSAAALTDKDKADILTAAKIDADYVAVSFPRTADDIHEARMLLNRAGSSAGIVAKIERAEALDVIDEIIIASDAIMVARGDLGVEIGDANLPPVQKDLIKRARALDKVAITATQMMESMITNPIPTRAEVFDVANAVVDGTDVIMLSAETAAGKYPVKAIEAMDRVCLETEKQPNVRLSNHRVESQFERSDEAIAMSAMYLANHGNCKAIVSLTCTGSTPLWMSRISSGIPIFAFTHDPKTASKVTLYRGVFPFLFEDNAPDQETRYQAIFDIMKNRHQVSDDDNIIITHGDFHRVEGGTNTLQIVKVR